MNHPQPSDPTKRWLLTAVACIALAACGGGGGSAGNGINATVAAQVQTLKPDNAEDSKGVFIELDTTQLSAAAQGAADASAQQLALQQAFLAQLVRAAQQPTVGATTASCDVTQLTQRIKDAYLPTSGAAVRLELNACEFDLLPGMALVKGVHPDTPLATQNTATTVSAINNAVKYGFDGSTSWPSFGGKVANGTGAVVAVMDTGVELKHPALQSKLVQGACFSTPTTGGTGFCGSSTADTTSTTAGQSCINSFGSTNRSAANSAGCGHGTSMAAVAAMNYSNGSVSAGGVAKGAQILPIQVFTGGISGGSASIYANSGDLLRAIEWLTTEAQRRNTNNLPRIAAVNMSLGGGQYASACDSDYTGNLFKTAFANLRAQGVLPVVAAGNEGQDTAVSFPACVSNVVAVGATQLGNGQIASYSNISSLVKVFAQGGDRGNTYSMPTTSASASSLDAWAAGAGTSPATAMVSGAVTVLRQLKPTATLDEIETALKTSDKPSITDRTGATRSIAQLRLSAAANKLLVQAADTPAPTVPAPVTPTPAPAAAPTLTGSGSASVIVGGLYPLTLSAADADGDLSSVALRWSDQSADDTQAASGASASVTFQRSFATTGTYSWMAVARDAGGRTSGTLTGQVTVQAIAVPTPVPAPVASDVMRLCVYSQINYAGQRACGIFNQGESLTLAGYWTIRSVKYLAFDASKPYDMSQELATATQPKVTFYNTTLARRRDTAGSTAGTAVTQSTPDLTRTMPNSLVSAIGFAW